MGGMQHTSINAYISWSRERIELYGAICPNNMPMHLAVLLYCSSRCWGDFHFHASIHGNPLTNATRAIWEFYKSVYWPPRDRVVGPAPRFVPLSTPEAGTRWHWRRWQVFSAPMKIKTHKNGWETAQLNGRIGRWPGYWGVEGRWSPETYGCVLYGYVASINGSSTPVLRRTQGQVLQHG